MKTTAKLALLLTLFTTVGTFSASAKEAKDPFAGVSYTKEKTVNHQRKDYLKEIAYEHDTQLELDVEKVGDNINDAYYAPLQVGTDAELKIDMKKHRLSLRSMNGQQFKKYATGIYITSGTIMIDNTHGIDILSQGSGYRSGIFVDGRETMKGSQGYFGNGQSGLIINNTDSDDDVVRIRLQKQPAGWMHEHEPLVQAKGEVGGYAKIDIKGRVDLENTDVPTELEPYQMGGKIISAYKGDVSIGSGRFITQAPIAFYAGFTRVYDNNVPISPPSSIKINSTLQKLPENDNILMAYPTYHSDVNIKGMVWFEANSTGAISLVTPKSKLEGTFMGKEGWSSNYLTLKDKAIWDNVQNSVHPAMQKYQSLTGIYHSYLKTLKAGDNPSNYGTIIQGDTKPIEIETYKGHARVFYQYDNDDPIFQNKGNIEIAHVIKGSSILLYTDSYGDNESTDMGKRKVLKALARKLVYHGAATKQASAGTIEYLYNLSRNNIYQDGSDPKTYLMAGVGVFDTLTKPEKVIKCGRISFDDYGFGVYDDQKPESFVEPLAKAFAGDKGTNLEDLVKANAKDKGETGKKVDPPAPGKKVDPPAPGKKVDPPAPGKKVDPPAPGKKVDPPAPGKKVDPPAPGKKVDPPAPGKKVDPDQNQDHITPAEAKELTKEAVAVKSMKSVIFSSTVIWNAQNNDLQKRLGELHLQGKDTGAWAKYQGGSTSLDVKDNKQNSVTGEQKYNGVQIGYDKTAGDWTLGGAFAYMKTDDTYASGTGKGTTISAAVYGTKLAKDGAYLDLIAKIGRINNDFDVHTKYYEPNGDQKMQGDRVRGTYKPNSLLLSIEYGKRLTKNNGVYLEPSTELTFSNVGAYDDELTSEKNAKVKFHSDAVTSFIGKIGVSIGQKTANSNVYGKISLAHEFGGEVKADITANNYQANTTIDMSDTWLDLELGTSYKMSDNSYFYSTFSKNFGAKLNNKWRLDAGLRFAL